MTILELTPHQWPERWQPLLSLIKDRLEIDAIIQSMPWSISSDLMVEDKGRQILGIGSSFGSDAVAVIVDPAYGKEIVPYLPRQTQTVVSVGACDLLVHDKRYWWPRCLLEEAFTSAISKYMGRLDLNSSALVSGINGLAYMSISALVKLGFGTINVTDMAFDEGSKAVEDLRKKYFQVEFNFIPFKAITRLPGVHSLMVNTTDLSLENELLDELYFFNFLKAGGAVIDLTLVPSQTPLIQEAKLWGARHLSGDFVFAERDALLVENIFRKKIQASDCRIELRKIIDAVPFDPTPYLRRFRDRGS